MDTNVVQELKDTSDTPVHTFSEDATPAQKREQVEALVDGPKVPDFRSLGKKQDGFATEIGTSDADQIKQKIAEAHEKEIQQPVTRQKKAVPVIHTIAGYRVSKALPDDSRIGWTSLSNAKNPGGSLNIHAMEAKKKLVQPIFVFHQSWRDYGIIFIVGIGFHMMAKMGLGVGMIILALFTVGTYFMVNQSRFYTRSRDDILRQLAGINLAASDPEKANWLNSFLQKFWLIFEPVLSAYVVENIDTYLVDYLPGFLDSVRLTTFTLGSKPFTVDSVKTFTDTGLDTICMDWTVSFKPNDTFGMSKAELDRKINPKVVLNIRLGKGFVGTAIPVLVENMSFKGRIRIKFQLMSKMPHVRLVEVCFMEKPLFDYVLKPVGGETFGFDVNNIPGLQSFVRDQTHAILGPMMYYPNVFAFDVEKFFSGEMDISQANGVLAITVHSASKIQSGGDTIHPFVRFFLNEQQELEKTSVCENTNTPLWNETRFILLNSLDPILSLQLRSSNNTKKSGKKLATATFALKDLQKLDEYAIENKELPLLRRGKLISNLNVDMRYFPVSKPIENPDGTMIEAAPSNSGVLRITLHECRHLGYNNKVNPFANIKINGVDRFTTPTFKRTSNPKFERAYEILVLDKTEVYIRVSFIDSIAFADDAFLGAWTGYLHDIMERQEENEYWWDLKSRTGKPRMRMSVQWKPVVMSGLAKMGGSSKGIYSPPQGIVRFSFWHAKDLPSGNNDPYVRVRSGNQIRARTESLDNSQNPEWGEHHYVPIHSIHENLVLEVVDWSSGSRDKLLGSTVFELKELVQLKEEEGKGSWLEALTDTLEKNVQLSQSGSEQRGTLRYSAQFFPTMQLADDEEEDDKQEDEVSIQPVKIASASSTPAPSPLSPTFDPSITQQVSTKVYPQTDLHGLALRYTPDDLIDLSSYTSGVITVRIHEVKLNTVAEAYCQILVDSLQSQYKTETIKGRTLAYNEISDAFIKDVGFSRVAIVLKPAAKSEKEDDTLGYWYDSSDHIINAIQQRQRAALINGTTVPDITKGDGEWYALINPVGGGTAKIRLSFDYVPLLNYTVDPNESLENQGILRVTLLSAKNLKAADKSGTSDPYVRFTINGKVEKTSEHINKTLNPVWKGCSFEVPIISRVTASFRIEVFDWNQIQGDEPLGSGGLTLRGDMVESFMARDYDIPLDGVAGVTGSVRVRLKWDPQLLLRARTHSTFMSATRRMTTKMGTTAFNWGEKPASRSNTGPLKSIMEDDKRAIKSDHSPPPPPTGAVEGTIVLSIMEARDLKGKVNPVVHVQLGNLSTYKTKKVKKSTNPEWNEVVKTRASTASAVSLGLYVKDAHTFHTGDIGQWTSDVWDLVRPPTVNTLDKWLPLEPEGSGEIRIKIEFEAN